jgi:Cu/Ag efflux protein CusF
MTKVIDGPVKDVDPAAKTVKVGWLLGLLSTTLEVTDATHIAIEGEKGSLAMIQEGDQVKASYEARDGKNLATAIEVTQPEKESLSSKPARPPMESPQSRRARVGVQRLIKFSLTAERALISTALAQLRPTTSHADGPIRSEVPGRRFLAFGRRW